MSAATLDPAASFRGDRRRLVRSYFVQYRQWMGTADEGVIRRQHIVYERGYRPNSSTSHCSYRIACASICLGWQIEIDKISVRVTKVNGSSSPWLGGRGLDPSLHDTAESKILIINIRDFEFKDQTAMRPRLG